MKSQLSFWRKRKTSIAESVKFLENTVNINSGTHNLEGVKKVGMIYKGELEKLGFTTRWISMPTEMNVPATCMPKSRATPASVCY